MESEIWKGSVMEFEQTELQWYVRATIHPNCKQPLTDRAIYYSVTKHLV